MKRFLFFLFLPVFVFSLNSDQPLSFLERQSLNLQFYEINQKPPSDVDEIKGAPLQVGIPVNLNLSLEKIGNFSYTREGKTFWQMGFYAPNFIWLSFEFENFKIPENARFFIIKDENFYFEISYPQDGLLVIPPFPSNKCILEVDFEEEFQPFEVKLSTLVLGFKDFLGKSSSGPCQVDINCPEGADWQKEKRSVAIIYFSGYVCTGALINNIRKDCKNYFLTAHHCIGNDSLAQKTIFYWDYEWTECGGGDLNYSNYSKGATLRATNPASDFSLLELKEKPPYSFRLYYSGWTASPSPSTGAVVIHHPSGDAKKISIEQHTLIKSGDFWKNPHYEIGTTEPGSSGSPLFNMDHKIVGQLYGGVSACGNPKNQMWDIYGAFYISWDQGKNSATRLKDWLDPDNTGLIEVEGMDSRVCYTGHPRPF